MQPDRSIKIMEKMTISTKSEQVNLGRQNALLLKSYTGMRLSCAQWNQTIKTCSHH